MDIDSYKTMMKPQTEISQISYALNLSCDNLGYKKNKNI